MYTQYTSKTLNTSIAENTYNNYFWNRLNFVDIQGLVSRLAGQKINNDVIKGNDGKLNLMDNLEYKFIENDEEAKVQKAVKILKHAEKKNAKVLYVQRPWATGSLPYGYHFELDDQYNYWCKQMQDYGFPVLDLRSVAKDKIKFYITDHHWTIESSFYANCYIIDSLNSLFDLKLGKIECADINQYNRKNYENSFLGSEGIRTGKYFAGKDDFETLIPAFETNFIYEQYKDHRLYWKAEGTYEDVFINKELLEDPNYNNKYAAYTYDGYIENRIVNYKSDNNLKVLLIADSYARPMVTYLAMNFKEIRYLDPQ